MCLWHQKDVIIVIMSCRQIFNSGKITRTHILRITSPVLHPLSYRGRFLPNINLQKLHSLWGILLKLDSGRQWMSPLLKINLPRNISRSWSCWNHVLWLYPGKFYSWGNKNSSNILTWLSEFIVSALPFPFSENVGITSILNLHERFGRSIFTKKCWNHLYIQSSRMIWKKYLQRPLQWQRKIQIRKLLILCRNNEIFYSVNMRSNLKNPHSSIY